MTPLAIRWVKFSAVGVLGIGVQLACLAVLTSSLRVNYLVATALAVEAAVLHNFVWHERYTWRDRTWRDRTWRDRTSRDRTSRDRTWSDGTCRDGTCRDGTRKDRRRGGTRDMFYRLARFHAGNGAVSILGNLALMRLFVGALGMNRYLAGTASIAVCSLLNFAIGEWFVFRRE